MMVASVETLIFSVKPYHVLVEVYIMRNIVFVGLVYLSEIDRRIESW